MRRRWFAAPLAAALLAGPAGLLAGGANAAELPAAMPVKAPAAAGYDWTGAYVGAFFGYGGGTLGAGTSPVLDQGVFLPATVTGLVGGYETGFNVQLPTRLVLGGEIDLMFTSPIDRPATPIAPFNTKLDYVGTAKARIGYLSGSILPYLTGGIAFGQTSLDTNDSSGAVIASQSAPHLGWTLGAGVAFPVAGHWTGKVEFNFIDLGPATFFPDGGRHPGVTAEPRIEVLKAGLNYRFGDAPQFPNFGPLGPTTVGETSDFNVHGQTTFVGQGYPSFHSPYQGPNSLPGAAEARETWTATGFLGWRLWPGGEFYFDPELDQGFGLGNTLGVAGFPNGEAQKGGSAVPKFRAQRFFLRETIGLGGEQETVADGANQLAGKRDIDRVTITVGRFAVGDFFDNNAYAHDPRADFMNWGLWEAAAYDFPADLPGFTRGAVVELNRKDWALRAGVFQVPPMQNSDVLVFDTGGAIVELEERYAILGQGGKLRLGAFANRGFTGNYDEALAIAAADPAIDINAAMMLTRKQRPKYGFYANAEQAITSDVGLYARASWNDGRNEILSFTDIDASVSGGIAVKGTGWGRPNDTVGLGAVVNGLSGPHRDFLAAGGLGLIIGDGRLDYREEKIVEAYYACQLEKWLKLTLDYQFVADPAYNADRGPVSLVATRLHAEF